MMKKKVAALGFILHAVIFVTAQTDTSTYTIVMNSGTRFNCKIIELKKDEFIRVLKADSSVSTIGWDAFKDYQKTYPEIKSAPKKRIKADQENGSINTEVQVDSPIYQIILKNSLVLYAKIVSIDTGNSMTVKKYTGGIQFLQWSEIKEYHLTLFTSASKELEEIRKAEEIIKKYAHWERCHIIKSNKDTLKGWVQFKEDYSTMGEGQSRTIKFANAYGVERFIEPEEYSELVILSKEPVRYVSFSPKGMDYNNIYTLLIDGPCRLLHDIYVKTEKISMMMAPAGPMGIGGAMFVGEGEEINADRYYLSYNDKWVKVRTEKGSLNIASSFRNRCDEVFGDCPSLVSQIQNSTYGSNDLRDIVNGFNQCIEKK